MSEGITQAPKCSRIIYIVLGIFLGSLGIHNFVAGYTKKAVIQLLISVLSLGILSMITFIWAIIDIITVQEDVNGVTFN